jgi:flavin reductase (DIM6/NTAB) family NADH-FMN oxidoreductase RutF
MARSDALSADLTQALRRLAATPCVLAARGADGARVGMTATAVTALSLEPASLLISIDRARSLHGPLTTGQSFSVNLLDEANAELCQAFAGRTPQRARFAAGDWRDGSDGAPFLAGAVSLSCRADTAFDYGTHTIVAAAVSEVRLGARAAPVAYAQGAVHRLATL